MELQCLVSNKYQDNQERNVFAFHQKKIICKKWKDKFNNKPFSDIVYINYYLSFVRPTGIHSFGEYRYYKIGFKDEDSFIITCLMTYDIDTNFGALLPMEAEKHDRLIAFVY